MAGWFGKQTPEALSRKVVEGLLEWGVDGDGDMGRLQKLYADFVTRVPPAGRRKALVELVGQVDAGNSSFNAFVPILFEDPDIGMVISAAIEVASYVPEQPGVDLPGPRLLIEMIDRSANLDSVNHAGILKGLLLLGDRRVAALLKGTWKRIHDDDIVPFLTVDTGYVYGCWVDFLLDWAEATVTGPGHPFGVVAKALARVPHQVAASMDPRILDVRRPFPITGGTIERVGAFTVAEYGARIQERMRLIAEQEDEPVLMRLVANEWGVGF